jgi:hypothetical protein
MVVLDGASIEIGNRLERFQNIKSKAYDPNSALEGNLTRCQKEL